MTGHISTTVMGVMTLIICRLSPPVRDHSRGLAAIHKAGGITMVLTPAAPPEKGMPENAISYDGPIDLIGNPHCLAEGICAACATQKSLISHRS